MGITLEAEHFLAEVNEISQTFLWHFHTYMMKIKAVIKVSLDRDKI